MQHHFFCCIFIETRCYKQRVVQEVQLLIFKKIKNKQKDKQKQEKRKKKFLQTYNTSSKKQKKSSEKEDEERRGLASLTYI